MTPSSSTPAASIADREVFIAPEYGPEPSVRQLARFYYAQHGQDDPDADAAAYVAALRHSSAPASVDLEGALAAERERVIRECAEVAFNLRDDMSGKTAAESDVLTKAARLASVGTAWKIGDAILALLPASAEGR